MARKPARNIATQANYDLIIEGTRNRTFEFKDRENTIATLQCMGVLDYKDRAADVTELLSRLVDYGVLKARHPHQPGESIYYKFTGSEEKWHISRVKPSAAYLQTDYGPAYELSMFINSAWSGSNNPVEESTCQAS